jgi:hypothetical protein
MTAEMRTIRTLAPLALGAAAALLAASGAEAKTVTLACTKDLATGMYHYDLSNISEDYIITVVHFREISRDSRVARGVCTINLKYQPAD